VIAMRTAMIRGGLLHIVTRLWSDCYAAFALGT